MAWTKFLRGKQRSPLSVFFCSVLFLILSSKMKFMKLGSKPDAFRADGKTTRWVPTSIIRFICTEDLKSWLPFAFVLKIVVMSSSKPRMFFSLVSFRFTWLFFFPYLKSFLFIKCVFSCLSVLVIKSDCSSILNLWSPWNYAWMTWPTTLFLVN